MKASASIKTDTKASDSSSVSKKHQRARSFTQEQSSLSSHNFGSIKVFDDSLKSGGAGLSVNQPGDKAASMVQRYSGLSRNEPGRDTGNLTAPGIVEEVLQSPGQQFDPRTRSFMEARFGQDFGNVKIHTGAKAAKSSELLNAHAYTYGQNIVFGAGRYTPDNPSGKRLIAHELAHVLQQRPTSVTGNFNPLPLSVSSSMEREAEGISTRVLSGRPPGALPARVNPVVARQTVDVDLEVPSPQERQDLRQRGIDLPQVSAVSADPLTHSDYIDRRVTAVGYSIYLGGFMCYCEGLQLPVFIPQNCIDYTLTSAATSDPSIFPDRTAAVNAIPVGPPASGVARPMTYFRGGGGLIYPAFFSPATTPRFIATALDAQREYVRQVQDELAVLGISIIGGMILNAIIGRILRVGRRTSEPARVTVPPGTGRAFGQQMAQEMRTAGYRGNPFREFMRRLNTRAQRLPPSEAAEAIAAATREFSGGTMGTAPPVQQGGVLVVPSRAPIPNAPVMGIRSDGTVIMGRVPRIEIITRDAQGAFIIPPRIRLEGEITWE